MSAILSADDLNDFISPSAACIKPVVIEKSENAENTEIQIGSEGTPIEVSVDGQSKNLAPAQISLSDCLACSGCITSAESVLVSLQSYTELLSILEERGHQSPDPLCFIASISDQTRVSLAAAFGISVDSVDCRLAYIFKDLLGFNYIVGTGIGRSLALAFGGDETLEKKSKGQVVLSSSCPGWICYVEKTHPHMIPYLSETKSPQQITGSLLKTVVAGNLGLDRAKIYHLSVMPCFDKKLEASRPEFAHHDVRDVDCVITTKELIQLLESKEMQFMSIPDRGRDLRSLAPPSWPVEHDWQVNEGSSSGGYLYHYLSRVQSAAGIETKVQAIPGRNSDIIEYVLTDNTGNVLTKAAQIYGFRNIQNLVRKLKPKKGPKVVSSRSNKASSKSQREKGVDWDYVEVMACPGGCISGGGQIGAPQDKDTKQWKAIQEDLYQNLGKVSFDDASVRAWAQSVWSSHPLNDLLHMTYHEVEKDPELSGNAAALTLGSKW